MDKTNDMTNFDWAFTTSIGAFVMAQVALTVDESTTLTMIINAVSSISAVVLCLTSIIKLGDMIVSKYKKWFKNNDTDNQL
jgi:hypothetical protein